MHPQEPVGAEANFPAVGRWLVTALPSTWMFVANFGVRQIGRGYGDIRANIALGEDRIAGSGDLRSYIAAQVALIEGHLVKPVMAGPQATSFPGADEAYLLFVRHTAQETLLMLHAQTYVRVGEWLGIITLTTPESELKSVRPDYDGFVKGLRILPA